MRAHQDQTAAALFFIILVIRKVDRIIIIAPGAHMNLAEFIESRRSSISASSTNSPHPPSAPRGHNLISPRFKWLPIASCRVQDS